MSLCERLEKERWHLSEVDACAARQRMSHGSISTMSMSTVVSIVKLWAKKELSSIITSPTVQVSFSSCVKTVTIVSLKGSHAHVVVPLDAIRRSNAC